MANVVDASLTNRRVFMQQHAHDVEGSSTWYRKVNGIPSPLVMTQVYPIIYPTFD